MSMAILKLPLADRTVIRTMSRSAMILMAASLIPLYGCGKTPLRPQEALRSPSGYIHGGAMLYDSPAPHPLVVISLPNTPQGQPHVDTVLSVLAPHRVTTTTTTVPPPPVVPSTVMQVHEEAAPTAQPATTRPTTPPATAPAKTNQNVTAHAVVPARSQ